MYIKQIKGTMNIANMPDAEAIAKGYKLAVFSEKPETEKGHHAVSEWTETEDSYVQSWTIEEEPSDDSCDYAEAYEILTGGAE